eukprot:Gb_30771 [translate_table: standard]
MDPDILLAEEDCPLLSVPLSSETRNFARYQNLSKPITFIGFFVKKKFRFVPWNREVKPKLKPNEITGKANNGKAKVDGFCYSTEEAKIKVKRSSSWLPDPSHRWPVQGW